jgi:hypothetical protein
MANTVRTLEGVLELFKPNGRGRIKAQDMSDFAVSAYAWSEGNQGPQGPQGNQGSQGPQGNQGPQGDIPNLVLYARKDEANTFQADQTIEGHIKVVVPSDGVSGILFEEESAIEARIELDATSSVRLNIEAPNIHLIGGNLVSIEPSLETTSIITDSIEINGAAFIPTQYARKDQANTFTEPQTLSLGGTPVQLRRHSSTRGLEIVPGGSHNELFVSGQIRNDSGFNCSTTTNGTSLLDGHVGKANRQQGIGFPGNGSDGAYLEFLGEGDSGRTLMGEWKPKGSDAGLKILNVIGSAVGLRVRGAVGQTGDLHQWQNSTGGILGRITSNGNLTLNSGNLIFNSGNFGNGVGTLNMTTNATLGTNGGVVLRPVGDTGLIFTPPVGTNREIIFAQENLTKEVIRISPNLLQTRFDAHKDHVCVRIVGAVDQTANLQEWRHNSGANLGSVSASGGGSFTSMRIESNALSPLTLNAGEGFQTGIDIIADGELGIRIAYDDDTTEASIEATRLRLNVERLGFFGGNPIAREAFTGDLDNEIVQVAAAVQDIRQKLINLGLVEDQRA